MATAVTKMQTVFQDVLANYLISMARTVETSVESALDALMQPSGEGGGPSYPAKCSWWNRASMKWKF